jgi:hypothetical protein
MSVAFVISSSDVTPANALADNCGYAYKWVPIINPTSSARLASFDMRVYFCYDGQSVTQVYNPEVWGAVTSLGSVTGWKYKKEYDFSQVVPTLWSPPGAGVWLNPPPWRAYDVRARGRFEDCPPSVSNWILPCTQSINPALEINLHGDGTYS